MQLLLLLAAPEFNFFCVGDFRQCWDSAAEVNTKQGVKLIKDLQVGDFVETMKNGAVKFSKVTNASPVFEKDSILIKTATGKELIVSHDHKCFVTKPSFENDTYYVYLMYREDKGYRIGVTKGGLSGTIGARANPERPERLWFISKHANRGEAELQENKLSLRYQIPTNPFFHNGRSLSLNQAGLDELFNLFGFNGFELLKDLQYSFDYPHYIAQGTSRNGIDRTNINLVMNSKKSGNQIYFEKAGERIRKTKSNYKEARGIAESLLEEHNAHMIYEKYAFKERQYLDVVPATQILPSMKIPVIHNDQHILDEVVSVSPIVNKSVRDIEVAETGILIANNIITHNSIYGFRGSDLSIILSFQQMFPSGKLVYLLKNYRSTRSIVEVGNRLIENNVNALNKDLESNNPTEHKIKYIHLQNEFQEAAYIVAQIKKKMIQEPGTNFKDFAVLYRTNAQSRVIEDVCRNQFIPTVVIGGLSFYQREEIKDIVAYLRVIFNEKDDVALSRILNKPARGIGKTTEQKVLDFAAEKNISISRALRAIDSIGLNKRAAVKIEGFIALIEHFKTKANEFKTSQKFVAYIMDQSGLMNYYMSNKDAEEKVENLQEFMRLISQYEEQFPENTIEDFIQDVTLSTDTGKDASSDAVQLMTIHRSKGLEFKNVFSIGWSEGLFPSAQSRTEKEIEEERRVAYVAITRAESDLFITHADTRRQIDGKPRSYKPSRFLNELPEELLEVSEVKL